MSQLDNVQKRLAQGISSWLLFEFHCQRGDLFSEKYLTVPIGQILTGIYPGRIKAEVNHPLLQAKTAGRPPQLDFIVLNSTNWEVVIESKWVGNTTISLESIIWDLMRLEVLARVNNLTCYFVLAGFRKKLDPILANTHFGQSPPVAPFYTSKKNTKIKMDLHALPNSMKSALNRKMGKYPSVRFSEVISADYPHFYPEQTVNMSFQTYVWKINPFKKGRQTNQLTIV